MLFDMLDSWVFKVMTALVGTMAIVTLILGDDDPDPWDYLGYYERVCVTELPAEDVS